jgi:hypothetical protein
MDGQPFMVVNKTVDPGMLAGLKNRGKSVQKYGAE